MAEVEQMPGVGCRHYTRGRCLYEEHLNPGYARHWQCRTVLGWESAFDDFLLRAEAMDVAPENVQDLWRRQFERLARRVFECPSFEYGAGDVLPCIHVKDNLCRLCLPECTGRCRHYEAEEMNSEAE